VSNDASLIEYYAKRANEYERLYEKPERQNDLAKLKELFQKTFAGHDVLEIACGTGYWTQIVSQTAKSVTATDINEAVLEIARAKSYGCKVRFERAAAFDLAPPPKVFSAGLAAFWWSHLRKSEIKKFLAGFHRQFSAGALLAFVDNRFVPGSSTPISRADGEGNTYQLRRLENGTECEIRKNFPVENEVRNALADSAAEICWMELPYYWFLTYRLKQ
jgi:demethylmenaquinone methyltransferase/2-methoxy-6-polyprenyl-1,4-benzoquinol methylase